MIQLSSITNGISNIAQSAAVHAKNLCTDNKISAVFRTTVGAMQAHPYITLLGAGVAVYCCRGVIGKLVNKVKQAAHSLYTKAAELKINMINFFRRGPVSGESSRNEPNLAQATSSSRSHTTPSVGNKTTNSPGVQLNGTEG